MIAHVLKSINYNIDTSIRFESQCQKFKYHVKQFKQALMKKTRDLDNKHFKTIATLEYSITIFGIYIDGLCRRDWFLS